MQRDGLSEIDRSPGGEPGELRLRRLGYGDLPSVISIERRSFPTPWSLAMFVLELSKPVGDLPRGRGLARASSATWSAPATTTSGT